LGYKTNLILIALLSLEASQVRAQDEFAEFDVVESDDLNSLLNDTSSPTASSSGSSSEIDLASLENLEDAPDESLSTAIIDSDADLPTPLSSTGDDLDEIKLDLRDTDLSEATVAEPFKDEKKSEKAKKSSSKAKGKIVNDSINIQKSPNIFDVGNEEKQLIEMASKLQGQISNSDWNELATQASVSSYTVVKDDWLFKISKRLFGSGFYYPKIWALNQFITNPHLIEPGMVLSFTTGSGERTPEIKLGEFTEAEIKSEPGAKASAIAFAAGPDDFSVWGDEAKPDWLNERKNLVDQGVYVQYSTSDTIEDLEEASRLALVREYENYDPPQSKLESYIPANQYDSTGLDRDSKIVFNFKEGFYLNTFVTNNPVQDFGKVDSGPDENIYFTNNDRMYIKMDDNVNVLPGDRFSIYSAQGEIKHANSDRKGFKYAITGQIRVLNKIGELWESEVEETTGVIQRGDRLTVYTPKIDRITQTFNNRLIEAGILGSFAGLQRVLSYGDVLYLDRGRADGLEMGNVLEVYGFRDRATGKVIARQPTYKTGELTVITLTDNFATVLVSNSTRDFYAGDVAITKTKEAAMRAAEGKNATIKGLRDGFDEKSLDELDVELNVEDLNDSLLDKADKIQLTEDELAELERQEREKSIIKDSEKDLKALERLESEIEGAEKLLKDARMDEDKLLEGESLEELERRRGLQQQESLDEIEENLGKRYIDEDINNKDNPFGLTEFDIEEVDELLNVEKPKE